MLSGVVASLILVAVCAALITWVINKRKEEAGTFAVLTPSVIFTGGILARFAIGSLMIALTPAEHVLGGEYRQYVVSWLYSKDTAMLWIAYLIAGSTVFGLLERCKSGNRSGRVSDAHEKGWFSWMREARTGVVHGYKKIKGLTFTLLLIYFIGSCISAWTGSMDRGAGYNYWAEKAFRPEALFIAFARLRQIGYFLLPITWKHSSRLLRGFLFVIGVAPLIMDTIAGGRGSVLYPVIMVYVGYLCIAVEIRKGLVCGALMVLFMGVAVPYMAAYRDSAAMVETNHRDISGRLNALLTGVDSERVVYRYMALGREVYACSDGFIVEAAVNRNLMKVGIDDIRLGDLGRILLPRWMSKDKRFEKTDGPSIAKGLMGVENKNWFPCITTPADLFRRGRWTGVVAGGAVMGVLMWVFDRSWLRVGGRCKDLTALLMTVLPVTYVQAGMYGTVRELIWQLAWELPKYIILFWGIGKTLRWIELSRKVVKG